MKKIWIAAALAGLCITAASADSPPAAAPPYRPACRCSRSRSTTRWVTSLGLWRLRDRPRYFGSQAQAVQGITGGVPLPIQGGNATAVKTDGSAVTQPVSAASLPLPTGAATAAAHTVSG